MGFAHDFWGIRPWTRHSLVLLVAGLSYVAIGMSYFYALPNGPRWDALVLAREWMPLRYWGAVFVLAGLLAVVSARWPPVAETWGYMVLTGLSAGWGMFHLLGVLVENAPRAGYTSAATWFLVAFLWWSISGLANPSRVVIRHGSS